MNPKFQCKGCYNFIEHCWCGKYRIAMSNGTQPRHPADCICESCIEDSLNAALLGVGSGVLPGDSLSAGEQRTEHLGIKCECGAKAIGGQYHSHWCPAFIE